MRKIWRLHSLQYLKVVVAEWLGMRWTRNPLGFPAQVQILPTTVCFPYDDSCWGIASLEECYCLGLSQSCSLWLLGEKLHTLHTNNNAKNTILKGGKKHFIETSINIL